MKLRLQVTVAARSAPFEHPGPTIRIGRDPSCELTLSDEASPGVSWQHAQIDLAPGGAAVRDLGSSNGTFVNGRRITVPTALLAGDTVRLGQAGPQLKVVQLDLATSPGPDVPACLPDALSASVPDRKQPSTPTQPRQAQGPDPKTPRKAPSATQEKLRELQQNQRLMLIGAGVVVAVLVFLAAMVVWHHHAKVSGVSGRVTSVEGMTTEHAQALMKQGGKIEAIEHATWDLLYRLGVTEERVTDLTEDHIALEKRQAELHKQQAESVLSLQRQMEERLDKILAQRPELNRPSIAGGTSLNDALQRLEQHENVTIVLDEAGFQAQGVKALGKACLRQEFTPGTDPLETVLRKLLDQLEPIGGVSRDDRPREPWPGTGRVLGPSSLVATFLVAVQPPRQGLLAQRFPIPVKIERHDGYVLITPAASQAKPERPAPGRLEEGDWSQPRQAWMSVLFSGRSYLYRVELLAIKPPNIQFREVRDSRFGRPRILPFRAINWIRTPDNYHRYNQLKDRFDPVFTHYKFTQTTEKFFRQVDSRESRLSQGLERLDAIVEFRDGWRLHALVAPDNSLELVLSLPFDDPPVLPAERIAVIRTVGRTWWFDKGEFTTKRPTDEERRQLLEDLAHYAQVAAVGRMIWDALRGRNPPNIIIKID